MSDGSALARRPSLPYRLLAVVLAVAALLLVALAVPMVWQIGDREWPVTVAVPQKDTCVAAVERRLAWAIYSVPALDHVPDELVVLRAGGDARLLTMARTGWIVDCLATHRPTFLDRFLRHQEARMAQRLTVAVADETLVQGKGLAGSKQISPIQKAVSPRPVTHSDQSTAFPTGPKGYGVAIVEPALAPACVPELIDLVDILYRCPPAWEVAYSESLPLTVLVALDSLAVTVGAGIDIAHRLAGIADPVDLMPIGCILIAMGMAGASLRLFFASINQPNFNQFRPSWESHDTDGPMRFLTRNSARAIQADAMPAWAAQLLERFERLEQAVEARGRDVAAVPPATTLQRADDQSAKRPDDKPSSNGMAPCRTPSTASGAPPRHSALTAYAELVASDFAPIDLARFTAAWRPLPVAQAIRGNSFHLVPAPAEEAMIWVLLGSEAQSQLFAVLSPRAYRPTAWESASTRLVLAIDGIFAVSRPRGARAAMDRAAIVARVPNRTNLFARAAQGEVRA